MDGQLTQMVLLIMFLLYNTTENETTEKIFYGEKHLLFITLIRPSLNQFATSNF